MFSLLGDFSDTHNFAFKVVFRLLHKYANVDEHRSLDLGAGLFIVNTHQRHIYTKKHGLDA